MTIKEILEDLLAIAGVATALYYVPFLIRLGWGKAENRTKKVCDICWKDINKVSKMAKSIEKLK